jgi:AraC family transcriptional regulator
VTAALVCNVRGGVARFEREGRFSRGRIYAAVKQWTAAESELVHCRREHTLVMTLSGGTSLTGNRISSTLRYEGVDRRGSVSFVPAGAERRGWYRDANMTFVAFVIAPEIGPAGELAAFTNRRDPVLERILRDLARDLEGASSAYVESAARAALDRLADRRPPRRTPALSRRERGRVTELVEAQLDADLSLDELAAAVGMSADRFARRFVATFGIPPHRFVIERRIARARMLLADRRRSLAEIALSLGFASQSHFTTAFRRHTGATPGSHRR